MGDNFMRLEQGAKYRALFVLDVPTFGVTEEQIRSALEGVGFSPVQVWMSSDDLPADWPAEKKADPSDLMQDTVWAEGVWSKATADVPVKGKVSVITWEVVDIWPAQGTSPNEPPKSLYQGTPGTSPLLVGGLLFGGAILGAILIGRAIR